MLFKKTSKSFRPGSKDAPSIPKTDIMTDGPALAVRVTERSPVSDAADDLDSSLETASNAGHPSAS